MSRKFVSYFLSLLLCVPSWSMELKMASLDCWLSVLQFLDVEKIADVSLVSKNFYKMTNSEVLWKAISQRHFGSDGEYFKQDGTYKQIFQHQYLAKNVLAFGTMSKCQLEFAISDVGFAEYEKNLLHNFLIEMIKHVKFI